MQLVEVNIMSNDTWTSAVERLNDWLIRTDIVSIHIMKLARFVRNRIRHRAVVQDATSHTNKQIGGSRALYGRDRRANIASRF